MQFAPAASMQLARKLQKSRSLVRLELMSLVPLRTQIPPPRIPRNDQRNFLDPQPPLDLLLPLNRVSHVLEPFKINQSIDPILRGKPKTTSALLLTYPAHQTVSYAGVKSFGPIRHDVNEECFLRVRRHEI